MANDKYEVMITLADRLNELTPTPPELKAMQATAKRNGLDTLTMNEINAEAAVVRKQQRKSKDQSCP